MNGLNFHDEMVKNMMNATYHGSTIIPKEIPVKIFTQEALEEHDKQVRADAIEEYKKKIEFVEEWLLDDCKVSNPDVKIAFDTLKRYAEHLKRSRE